MTDDNLDDVQPKKLAWLYDKEARTLRHRETWNAAIEAAAKVAEINSAVNIRKLKK